MYFYWPKDIVLRLYRFFNDPYSENVFHALLFYTIHFIFSCLLFGSLVFSVVMGFT